MGLNHLKYLILVVKLKGCRFKSWLCHLLATDCEQAISPLSASDSSPVKEE